MKDQRSKLNNRLMLEELLAQMENIKDLQEQGNENAAELAKDDLLKLIDKRIQDIEKELGKEVESVVEKERFPKAEQLFAEGNKVRLVVICEAEREKYLALSREHSTLKDVYKEEAFREAVWKEFLAEKSFVCSIYEVKGNKYVGYCSIKDISKEDWELAIELNSCDCYQGYGTEALAMFLKGVYELTEKRFFKARVEVDNHASQGLMKKLGAYPDGISEHLLHGEAIRSFQEVSKNMITDEIRKVAEEFCMEAEDIMGYVLEYRFDMQKNNM